MSEGVFEFLAMLLLFCGVFAFGGYIDGTLPAVPGIGGVFIGLVGFGFCWGKM